MEKNDQRAVGIGLFIAAFVLAWNELSYGYFLAAGLIVFPASRERIKEGMDAINKSLKG